MTAIAIIPGIIIFLVVENIYFRFKIHWRDEEIKGLREYNEKVLNDYIDNHNLFICAKNLVKKANIRQFLIDEADEVFKGYYHDRLEKELFGDD